MLAGTFSSDGNILFLSCLIGSYSLSGEHKRRSLIVISIDFSVNSHMLLMAMELDVTMLSKAIAIHMRNGKLME